MAQVNKYRVHEVAKDFNVKSNGVIDLLGRYFDDPKKHQTALTDEELDIIFETLTQMKAVQSFDEYFSAIPQEKPKAEAKKESKAPAKDKKEQKPQKYNRLVAPK